jgi:hypothetical protein
MDKFTKTETIYADQWDGTQSGADSLIAELSHHGIYAYYHAEFTRNIGPNVGVPVDAMISFPGYHIHPTDYLVKEYLTEDTICWSVKSAKQMASYTKEKG